MPAERGDGILRFVIAFSLVIVCAVHASADDWPRFLGPNYDGISHETGWLKNWPSEGPPELLRKNVGSGASSMVAVGDRVYTMGNIRDRDVVWCLNGQTGAVIWRKEYACKLDKRMFEGGPAATPTIDGNRLYTLAHDGQVYCWSLDDGSILWDADLRDDHGGRRMQWGYAGSPLVVDNMVILDNGGRGTSTIALDKETGKLRWAVGDDQPSYASPVVATFGNQRVGLLMKARAVVGLDIENGRELFRYPWRTEYEANNATPLVDGDRIFISSGYNHGCALLQVSEQGLVPIFESKHMANQMDTSVIYDGHAYGISGNAGGGTLVCLELETQEVKWTEDSTKTGTVMLADGHLIVLSETGGALSVGPASPTGFNPTGRAVVFSGRSWIVPVLAHGRLFVKNNDGDLVALDVSNP